MAEVGIETKSGLAIETVFVDRFYVRVNGNLTKIVFSELVKDAGDVPRSALMLTTENAVTLANLILSVVQKNKEAQSANTASPSVSDG